LPCYLFQSPHTRLTLPTSEKNFVGPFPIGTQFTADSLIIGIHWRNRDNIRVDLDLSAINKDGKIGWNSTCYNNDQSVVHSGDVIDATNGANEYLYFRKHLAEPHIVLVNNYNNVENVEMEVIIATASKVPNRNEIVSDGQVIATAKTFCDKNQKAIGVVYPSDDGPVFVLIDKCLGSVSNISTWNMDKQIIIDSLRDNYLFMDDYMRSSSTVPKISDRYAVNFSNNLLSKSDILNIFSSSKNE
jgi:hypothetical protein